MKASRRAAVATTGSEDAGGVDDGEEGRLVPVPTTPVMSPRAQRSEFHTFELDEESLERKTAKNELKQLVLSVSFLLLVGNLTALLAAVVDVVSLKLRETKVALSGASAEGFPWLLSWPLWTGLSVALALLGTAVPKHVSDEALGSGIPEMKSILSGFVMNRYLGWQTLVSKCGGLAAAQAAGLSIGKEGPFVHIASCIASVMMDCRTFRRFKRNRELHVTMLSAAVAVGVTATFGAPFGGAIFSIEVTATYYMISNLYSAMLAAVASALTFTLLRKVSLGQSVSLELFQPTSFPVFDLDAQILAYSLLGVVCGLLGGLFLLITKQIALKRRYDPRFGNANRYSLVAAVSCVAGLLSFQFDILRCGPHAIVNDLFSVNELSYHCGGPDRFGRAVLPNLMVLILFKFVFTPICIMLPVPAGVFGPVFLLGAAVGRLAGEIVRASFPGVAVHAGSYAVVGAAAMSSAVTRTLSTSLIVFELTKQLSHMLPVLVAVLVAYSVSEKISASVYDTMIEVRGLPFMPHVRKVLGSQQTNAQVKSFAISCEGSELIAGSSTYQDALRIVRARHHPQYVSVPVVVVTEAGEKQLIGSVSQGDLRNAIEATVGHKINWPAVEEAPEQGELMRKLSRSLSSFSPGRNGAYSQVAVEDSTELESQDSNPDETSTRDAIALGQSMVFRSRWDAYSGSVQRGERAAAIIDPAPYTVVEAMRFSRMHSYFTMLSLSHAFVVTPGGILRGVISMEQLLSAQGKA